MKKEQEPIRRVERVSVPEEMITVEAPRNVEQNLEVASWIEKIEKKFARVPTQTGDVADDTTVVQQPPTQQPPITLPINKQQLQVGKTAKPDLGIAWLVIWAIRQMKLIVRSGKKVKFQDIPEVEVENK